MKTNQRLIKVIRGMGYRKYAKAYTYILCSGEDGEYECRYAYASATDGHFRVSLSTKLIPYENSIHCEVICQDIKNHPHCAGLSVISDSAGRTSKSARQAVRSSLRKMSKLIAERES